MTPQELEVQEKKETLQEKGEKTEPSRYYVPQTDIHESPDALLVTMDMPGVGKESLDIQLEDDVLTVTGKINFSNYDDLKPIYTEYNIGNYTRKFTLSNSIDHQGITAKMNDGVLEVHLPKVKEVGAKRIDVQ